MINMKFSVLMSVYFRETASNLNQALESLVHQSIRPNEILLVKDGPLTEDLDVVINAFDEKYPEILKIVTLKVNKGLGNALAVGLEACRFELIARMDSDDISGYFRFERQISFLRKNPDIDVVGCTLKEFSENIGDSNVIKRCPEFHDDMIKRIKLRSPMNHATIIFRKSKILNAGGYKGNTLLFEDYALFIRLWQGGLRFYNLPDTLYYMRITSSLESIRRRCGMKYVTSEINFLKYVHKIGAFSKLDQLRYGLLKFPIRLMPPQLVFMIYKYILRERD